MIDSGTTPEQAANAATGAIDNKVLKALTIRKPELVVSELEEKGFLHGPAQTEAGKEYTVAFLVHLKERTASTRLG